MTFKEAYQKATGKFPRFHIAIPWPLWFGSFEGFTLGPIIFYKPGTTDDVLVHELVHVDQWYRYWPFFGIRYLWELRKGYTNNKYEIEARDIQKRVVG